MTDECPCFMDSSGKIVHLPNCTKVENGGDSSTSSKFVAGELDNPTSEKDGVEPPKPEPDAWVWNKYVLNKTSSVSVTTVDKPRTVAENLVKEGEIEDISKINKVPESEERLFSAETIQDTARFQEHPREIEHLGRKLEAAVNGTIDKELVLELVQDVHEKADEIGELEEVFSAE